MDIVKILQEDYQHFPEDQTYSIYAENVYFKDPLNEFRGREKYKQMLNLLNTIFQEIKMDVHDIGRHGNMIETEWTLNLTSPLPWKPRLAIPGKSELKLNEQLIVSHIDIWHISRFNVLKQNFFPNRKNPSDN